MATFWRAKTSLNSLLYLLFSFWHNSAENGRILRSGLFSWTSSVREQSSLFFSAWDLLVAPFSALEFQRPNYHLGAKIWHWFIALVRTEIFVINLTSHTYLYAWQIAKNSMKKYRESVEILPLVKLISAIERGREHGPLYALRGEEIIDRF